jgi:hypothetical protein
MLIKERRRHIFAVTARMARGMFIIASSGLMTALEIEMV